MYAKKNSGKKVIALLLILVLLIGCTIGATVAYLIAKSGTVTNTFVAGNIGTLTLKENGQNITDAVPAEFTVIPGVNIDKNVTVSYSNTAEQDVPVYVFVKVAQTGWTPAADKLNFTIAENEKTLASWGIADGWTLVQGQTDVYYREASATAGLNDVLVLKDNGTDGKGDVVITADVTTANMSKVTAAKIEVSAYAIQKEGFSGANAVADAWAAVKPN